MSRRKRRSFTAEQKAEAVCLVQVGGQSIYRGAKDLDLTETALRRWVRQADVHSGPKGLGPLTTEEREQLRQLKRENRRLRMERDFLKEATAFFARDSSRLSK